MSRPLNIEVLSAVDSALTAHGYKWDDLAAYFTAASPTPALAPTVTGNGNPPALKTDYDSAWVKATAEAILKSNARLTPNAQTFVAQTFARASQYDTVKFSQKQWDWFNKIMLTAGVEAQEIPF